MRLGLLISLGLAAAGCSGSPDGPDTDGARALIEEGRAAAAEGNHAAAVDLYTRALEADPGSPDAYYERGYSNVRLRRSPDVPGHARVYEDRALLDYSEAIRRNPALAGAYFDRAMIRASRAQYKDAVEDLLSVVKVEPRNVEAHYWLGHIYEEKFEDRMAAAMDHYEKYVEAGGRRTDIYERVKLWKELKKQAALPPSKAPTAEDEKKAEELHETFKQHFAAGRKPEALKVIEDLMARYGHTQYVQKRARELNALLNALKR